MRINLKKIFSIALPFFLSAGLLGWLFYHIDYKKIWMEVKSADMQYLIAAGILYFLINFLIWWRWMILMKAIKLSFKKFSSLRWFFIGLTCNLLPITSVGGDVVKGLGIAQETGFKTKVFASIVLDRLIGFMAIVLIAFLAFWGGHKIVDNAQIMVSIMILTVISLGLGSVLFSHRLFQWAITVFGRWPKIKDSLLRLHYDIVLFKGKQDKAIVTLFISILAQVALAVDYYLIAKALHQDISLFYFIIFSPLVCVAQIIPSVGGLGVREQSWVILLANVGIAGSAAAAISIINFFFMLVVGLLGGIFYVATFSVRRVQLNQTSPVLS